MKRLILISLVVLVLLLSACGSQKVYLCPDGSVGGGQPITSNKPLYICPNGQQVTNYESCEFVNQVNLLESDAEVKALNFVNGYLMTSGWQSTLVNVNIVEGDWLAQIVVSKYDETSFETVIRIDGQSGYASCAKNCDYLEN